MKIVILGANGQLGRRLVETLPGDIVALSRAGADLTRPVELRQRLSDLRPRVVVNAAGYTQVDRAEAEPDQAFAVNAVGVRDLATICRALDCTLVHFSTDYVFGLDTQRTAAYSETDEAHPLNVYGASKFAGEKFIQDICPKHFILRTCGLYGPLHAGSVGTNFVAVMLRKAAAGSPVRVVDDQVCTPTSTLDLARATCELLNAEAFGLYHVTNAESCSWFEFAQTIFELAKVSAPLVPIMSAEYASPARRPSFSVLNNAKWLNAGFAPLRPWREALESFLGRRGK